MPGRRGRKSSNNHPKRGGKSRRPRNGANNGKSTGRNAAQGSMTATTATTGLILRSLPLFPYRCRRSLNYYDTSSITTGASTANAYVFSANGAFDPNISGTGGQPMGFDQMMTFYNHYTVMRSRIRIECVNSSTVQTVTAGIAVSGSATVVSGIEQLLENGDVAIVRLNTVATASSMGKLGRRLNVAKFQGIDDIMDDPNMRGDASSNPSEQVYYHFSVHNPFSATQATVFFEAFLEYDIMFHEPRKGSISSMQARNGENRFCAQRGHLPNAQGHGGVVALSCDPLTGEIDSVDYTDEQATNYSESKTAGDGPLMGYSAAMCTSS
jgi:hypothetical protein